ncbi:hypothetical protein AC1031_002616 [Aphanomyces cochlioides]|nr:hypothetical protein AC1031_002616 [Aphanomyces cochlioides]
MAKQAHAQALWSLDLELALLREILHTCGELLSRWEEVAKGVSAYAELSISLRSAREHFDVMKKNFERTDKNQLLYGTGSEEEVSEKVNLMQDIVERMDEVKHSKMSERDKEKKRKLALETTGHRLCAEAEERVSKRQKSKAVEAKEDASASLELQLVELEKKKLDEDHIFRMESLAVKCEEMRLRTEDQRLLAAQLEESSKRSAQMETLVMTFSNFIQTFMQNKYPY